MGIGLGIDGARNTCIRIAPPIPIITQPLKKRPGLLDQLITRLILNRITWNGGSDENYVLRSIMSHIAQNRSKTYYNAS